MNLFYENISLGDYFLTVKVTFILILHMFSLFSLHIHSLHSTPEHCHLNSLWTQ